MHRGFALGWALVLVLTLVGCAERITGEDVYAFPDSVSEITVHGYGMGRMTSCVLREEEDILPVLRWYEALELQPMDAAPEAAEGNQAWEFTVDGEAVLLTMPRAKRPISLLGIRPIGCGILGSRRWNVRNCETRPNSLLPQGRGGGCFGLWGLGVQRRHSGRHWNTKGPLP